MARHEKGVDARAWLDLLEKRSPRPMTIAQMASELGLDRYDRGAIKRALEEQVAKHVVRPIGKTRYLWVREHERQGGTAERAGGAKSGRPPRTTDGGPGRVEGRYARVRAGYGFVEVLGRDADRFRRDILIPSGMEGAALHGDRVEVEVVRRDPRLRRVVGQVTAVTGPVHERIIGTLEHLRDGWFLMPESDLLPPVRVVGERVPRREDAGLVALALVTRSPARGRWPEGELDRVLGPSDDPEVQFLAIAFEHGLRVEFPDEVQAEARRLPADPDESDFTGRRDLRALPFVTIDGESARDFDDAVCLEEEANGDRLWVAIADVSHYVVPRSALDREAAARGTSVYFPDRAIPMLPAELSSGLCSLLPDRPRLVLVAEMEYDRDGRRRSADFYRAVITSRARLTYTQVAAVLAGAGSMEARSLGTEIRDIVPHLERMRELMRKLFGRRVAAGSLDLDLPESMIDLSEEGRSVGVRLLERSDAHRLIEELMLEANRAVAIFLGERRVPFPYRIHEPPDPADVDELNGFLAAFGFRIDYDDTIAPSDVQRLLDRLHGHPMARVLSRQVLRSFKQAQYSTANAGHFGLAFADYCHFTSPIRRYPDLLVHRQLGRVFDAEPDDARLQAEALERASIESSQAEREAMEAERAMLDLKKAEFMRDHLHEPEAGVIVSVTAFGFYVELDAYPVEGLVRIENLTDDRYRYVEEERALVGFRKRQRLRIGDRVRVEATDVSLRRRQIDFALLERLGGTARSGGARETKAEKGRRKSKARDDKKAGKKTGPRAQSVMRRTKGKKR